MAGGTIASLKILLGLDSTGVEKGVGQAKTAISGFGLNSQTAFKAIGAGAALGFGLATKGALEAEAAQGKFMAATGKSREEAKTFVSGMNSLAGSAGAVGKSFEQIAATGTMVEQQFGTTGQATTDLTKNILEFSKVTGQDAEQAAADLEDTLSTFGLTADDAAGFMDKLVASNQKFGTDAGPEALQVLRDMAPALQAMGADIDDGVEFLNAFEVAGLDAAAAGKALTKAVNGLKPGETLDDLIAQVGAIEDPLLRAQKAAELFGTKAGSKLAQVIQPGMTSLDEFGISAEEAAGKVGQAAEDMLTFGDRIRGWADKAMAGARELGQQFGPLVSGLGAIGGLAAPFSKALSGLWGKIAGSSLVKAAVSAAGAVGGAFYSAAAAGVDLMTDLLKSAWQAVATRSPLAAVIAAAGAFAGGVYAAATNVANVLMAPISAAWTATGAAGSAVVKAAGVAGRAVGVAFGAAAVFALAFLADDIAEAIAPSGEQAGRAFFGAFGDEVKGLAHGTVFDSFFDGIHIALNRLGEWDPLRTTAQQQLRRVWTFATEHSLDPALLEAAFDRALSEGLSPAQAYDRAVGVGLALGQGTAAGVEIFGPPRPEVMLGPLDGYHRAGLLAGTAAADGGIYGIKQQWNIALEKARAGMLAPFAALGRAIPGEIGKGMMQESRRVLDSAETLRDILKNGLTPKEQAMEVMGAKYIKLVRQGMDSEIPGAKRTAQEVAIAAINTIEDAGLEGKKGQRGLKAIGIYYDELLASGMTAEQTATALKAAGVANDVIAALTGTKQVNAAETAGWNIGHAWGKGMAGAIWSSKGAINHAVAKATAATRGDSPPKEGPLREIDKWGFNVGVAWLGGLAKGIVGDISGPLSAVGRTLSPSFAPSSALAVAGGSGGGGGIHIHIHGPVYGGPAGLRQLSSDIGSAVRQTTRGAGRDVGAR